MANGHVHTEGCLPRRTATPLRPRTRFTNRTLERLASCCVGYMDLRGSTRMPGTTITGPRGTKNSGHTLGSTKEARARRDGVKRFGNSDAACYAKSCEHPLTRHRSQPRTSTHGHVERWCGSWPALKNRRDTTKTCQDGARPPRARTTYYSGCGDGQRPEQRSRCGACIALFIPSLSRSCHLLARGTGSSSPARRPL